MLILSRKKGQKLLIGDNIEITITDVDNGVVKIGVEAPKDISILREELYKELREQNTKSSQIDVKKLKSFKLNVVKTPSTDKIKSLSVKIRNNEEK